MTQPIDTHRLMDLAFPGRDESLARVIARLSEPDAGRVADNLITNEDSFARVATDLARLAPRNSVYLGVGPDQNFTYIAHARPSLAFIVDFRRRNALLHLAHKALMMLAPDRLSYLRRLIAREPAKPADGSAAALVTASRGAIARSVDPGSNHRPRSATYCVPWGLSTTTSGPTWRRFWPGWPAPASTEGSWPCRCTPPWPR